MRKYVVKSDIDLSALTFFEKSNVSSNFRYLLGKNNEGKYGIFLCEFDNMYNTINLREALPMAFDSIIPKSIESALFYKDGLVGCFPFVNETKYKNIEILIPNDLFYRITHPTGKRGWLNIENKEEYWDL